MKKCIKKQKKRKTNKRRDQETKAEHTQTEWVLCSEDRRDVIMYVPDLNNIPIEENHADISQEEIKDAFLKFGKCRKPHKKKTYLKF